MLAERLARDLEILGVLGHHPMKHWSSTAHASEQNRARESVTACAGR